MLTVLALAISGFVLSVISSVVIPYIVSSRREARAEATVEAKLREHDLALGRVEQTLCRHDDGIRDKGVRLEALHASLAEFRGEMRGRMGAGGPGGR